jgi:hypothetical protein
LIQATFDFAKVSVYDTSLGQSSNCNIALNTQTPQASNKIAEQSSGNSSSNGNTSKQQQQQQQRQLLQEQHNSNSNSWQSRAAATGFQQPEEQTQQNSSSLWNSPEKQGTKQTTAKATAAAGRTLAAAAAASRTARTTREQRRPRIGEPAVATNTIALASEGSAGARCGLQRFLTCSRVLVEIKSCFGFCKRIVLHHSITNKDLCFGHSSLYALHCK